MSSKTKCEIKHAKRRFLERFGLEISDEDLNYLRGSIKKNRNVTFVRRQSNRITVWDIEYKGKIFRCVYDKERHTIVTVLPKEEIKESG